jgi:uncharacterized protein
MPTIEQAQAWYDDSDPVHGLDHVLRVLKTAEQIGSTLGADLDVLRAAALLHDASGAHPGEDGSRADHENASAAFAAEVLTAEGWPEKDIERVMHCIRAHRFRGKERPQTLEAKVLFDADKLDVIGAFGTARTIGYAVQAGQPVFAEPTEEFLSTGKTTAGEPHSAYHEYLFKLRRIKQRLHTEPAKTMAENRDRLLCMFFDQLAAEARGEA